MSYQALYRAWRPATFSEMVGQEAFDALAKEDEELAKKNP